MSLLDVLRGVMLDPAEQAAYSANPSAYLERHGFEGVDATDLSEAFGLVADTLTPEQAQAWEASPAAGGTLGADTADFDADPGAADAALAAPAPEFDDGAGAGPAAGADAMTPSVLSFGEGDDGGADGLDDLSFEEATAEAEPHDESPGHLDELDEPGTLEGGAPQHLDDHEGLNDHEGLDDHEGLHDHDGLDDLDDLDEIDELGGIDGGEVDIGSF